jgi:membrane protein implicated in regulation of membrane protease activity
MSDQAAKSYPTRRALRARREERLRREIALLEHMDGRLWRKALACSAVAVALTAALLTLAALKLHWFGYDLTAIFLACLAIAAAAWWLGRYTLWIPAVLVVVALAIVFEGVDLPGEGWSDSKDKPDRRAKVAAALAKRRARLMKLEAQP